MVARGGGWNNLQGHARSVVPVAVLYARLHPEQLQQIRAMTDLKHDMGQPWSEEARNSDMWGPVMQDMQQMVSSHTETIVASESSTGDPQTVEAVATTYLSTDYGGGQTSGGAGNTVLKRTLKLLAHVLLH